MNTIVYKVVFNGINEIKEKTLNLSFKGVIFDPSIKIPSHFFSELKKLSELNQNILIFKNIDEVIKLGEDISLDAVYYYNVLLFQFKNQKEGFLIGNTKKKGDILLGTWPFNKIYEDSKNVILDKLNNLLSKHNEYDKICLIN